MINLVGGEGDRLRRFFVIELERLLERDTDPSLSSWERRDDGGVINSET